MALAQTLIKGSKFDVKAKIIFYDKSRKPTITLSEDYFKAWATLISSRRVLEEGEPLETKTV